MIARHGRLSVWVTDDLTPSLVKPSTLFFISWIFIQGNKTESPMVNNKSLSGFSRQHLYLNFYLILGEGVKQNDPKNNDILFINHLELINFSSCKCVLHLKKIASVMWMPITLCGRHHFDIKVMFLSSQRLPTGGRVGGQQVCIYCNSVNII